MTELKTQDEVVKNRVETMEVESIHPAPTGPGQMALEAIKAGAGKEVLEQLQKAWEMQQSFEKDTARKAYNSDMASWAENTPIIVKDKVVEFSTNKDKVGYSHATLGNIMQAINESMAPFGLHAHHKIEQPEGKIKVICVITHRLGHSENTFMIADADNSGSKNAIQAIGSTTEYLRRYTLLSITGIAAQDQDDDGAGSEPAKSISDDQFANLSALIQEVGADEAKFCKYMKISDLDHLPAAQYEKAVKALEGKKK